MANEGVTTKVHCDKCGGERNHEVLKCHQYTEQDEYMNFKSDYMIVSCKGCETIRFCTESQHSEDCEWDHYQQQLFQRTRTSIFPIPTKKSAHPWQRVVYLDKGGDLHFLLEEMYVAYNHNQPRLTAMAIRAVVDTIVSITLKDSTSPFKTRLERYQQEGHIAKNDVETLEVVIEVGHAATHRNWTPKMEIVESALIVLENLLQKICHREEILQATKSIPPKQKAIF